MYKEQFVHGAGSDAVGMADKAADRSGCQGLNVDIGVLIGVLIAVWQHTSVQAGLNILRLR